MHLFSIMCQRERERARQREIDRVRKEGKKRIELKETKAFCKQLLKYVNNLQPRPPAEWPHQSRNLAWPGPDLSTGPAPSSTPTHQPRIANGTLVCPGCQWAGEQHGKANDAKDGAEQATGMGISGVTVYTTKRRKCLIKFQDTFGMLHCFGLSNRTVRTHFQWVFGIARNFRPVYPCRSKLTNANCNKNTETQQKPSKANYVLALLLSRSLSLPGSPLAKLLTFCCGFQNTILALTKILLQQQQLASSIPSLKERFLKVESAENCRKMRVL